MYAVFHALLQDAGPMHDVSQSVLIKTVAKYAVIPGRIPDPLTDYAVMGRWT